VFFNSFFYLFVDSFRHRLKLFCFNDPSAIKLHDYISLAFFLGHHTIIYGLSTGGFKGGGGGDAPYWLKVFVSKPPFPV